MHAINCDYVRIQAEVRATGTTRLRISLGTARKLKVVFPNLEVQNKIVSYLKGNLNEIDQIIGYNEKSIKLFQQYRQSLISEAVTGKIDLRD